MKEGLKLSDLGRWNSSAASAPTSASTSWAYRS